MIDIERMKEIIDTFHNKTKSNLADLSKDQDLAIGIMNLIAIEEHLFFTGAKTEKIIYYDMINEIREMRKELLKKIIKEYEGEIWCTSKHLLTASMRMMEVGTKELGSGQKESAYDFFKKSYDLYMMFWMLNMNQKISEEDIKIIKNESQIVSEKLKKINEFKKETLKEEKIELKTVFFDKFKAVRDYISSKLDCCKE